MTRDELAARHCSPVAVPTDRLTAAEVAKLLDALPGWEPEHTGIAKDFRFESFEQTMAFVNAVAWLAQRENHHPDLGVRHRHCRVAFATHDVGGLSMNDFISAAKLEQLFAV